MIIVHIIFSIIGTVGSYFRFFRKTGSSATWIGLLGVVISGIVLFLRDQEKFLDSGKFLSNMTVMGVLIVTESVYLITKSKKCVIISMFSWTWIFAAALINPEFSYLTFIITYIILLLLTLSVVSNQSEE